MKLSCVELYYAEHEAVIDRDWVPAGKAKAVATLMLCSARARGIKSPIRVLVYPINERGNTEMIPDLDEVRT